MRRFGRALPSFSLIRMFEWCNGPQAAFDETRQMLIKAAGQVFAEEATVREVCSRAGINGAAVNYHFGDKLGLYTEVLRSPIFALQAAEDGWLIYQTRAPLSEC
jgi:AcrR family transcriptional regulator